MALYGIHWQMTKALRDSLPDGGLGMVSEQLVSSAQGAGAIIREGTVPDIQWFELDELMAMQLNSSLAGRGFDAELCRFEAGDWMVRATAETENGPG
jgi:hypothetical protein